MSNKERIFNPRTFIIKPTHECNLNCWYCYDKPNRGQGEMSVETFQNIYDKIINIDDCNKTLIWHGGEPTLMDHEKFYKEIYSKILYPNSLTFGFDPSKCNLRTSFQSNGTLMSATLALLIEKYDINFGTSYDGVTNDSSRKTDDSRMFDISLIEMISGGKKLIHEDSGLMVVTTINHNTVLDSYIKSTNNKSVSFSVYFGKGRTLEDVKIITSQYKQLWEEIVYTEDKYIPRPYDNVIESLTTDEGNRMCENINCIGKWASVHPNGDIQQCGRYWGDYYKFGNINEIKSIDEIESNEIFKEMVRKNNEAMEKCKKCDLYNYCMSGCPNDRYLHTGDIAEIDQGHCYITKLTFGVVKDFLKKMEDINLWSSINRQIIVKLLIPYFERNFKKLKETNEFTLRYYIDEFK